MRKKTTQRTQTSLSTTFGAICFTLIACLTGMLFIENFVFSESLASLGFREIDDLAFQATLRRCHLALDSGHFGFLGRTYDYAYGWFFWVPLTIITYPLFLLSQAGIDWPLIVFPRQLSVLFSLGTLFLVYKSLLLIKVPSIGRWAALLLLALYPSFSYFSMRFGTVHMLMFFSSLSLYLALSNAPSTPKGRLKIALAVAATCSIKLSGLFIAPVVAGLVWNRLQNKEPRTLLKTLWKPVSVFLFSLVALISPLLLIAPFNSKIAHHYINSLTQFINVTRVDNGKSLSEVIYDGLFLASPFLLGVMALLFMGLIITVIRKRSADTLIITGGLMLAVAYLSFSVKAGYNVYFTPIFFLLLFGVQAYSHSLKGKVVLIIMIALCLTEFTYRSPLFNTNPSKWSAFSYFLKEGASQDRLVKAQKIKSCIDNDLQGQKLRHIFIDHTLPIKMNSLTHPNTCISIAWNNLSPERAYCQSPVEYIVLDQKEAISALPEDQFNKKLQSLGPKLVKRYTEDRNVRQKLLQKGTFGTGAFSLLCDLEFGMVFRKKQ